MQNEKKTLTDADSKVDPQEKEGRKKIDSNPSETPLVILPPKPIKPLLPSQPTNPGKIIKE